MQNKKKAIITGLLGASMLVGGGIAFAIWQQEASVTGNTITTGSLTLSLGDVTWTDQSAYVLGYRTGGTGNYGFLRTGGSGAPALIQRSTLATSPTTGEGRDGIKWDPANYLLSPGDTIVARIPVTYSLAGTNLEAKLSISGVPTTANTPAGFTVTTSDTQGIPATGLHTSTDVSAYVLVTIAFDENSSQVNGLYTGSPAQRSVSLNGATITLQQNRS